MILKETVVLDGVRLEIELDRERRYRLRYGELVEYENGRRRLRGRWSRYEFRSIEQLRYDFERDVEAMGGALASHA